MEKVSLDNVFMPVIDSIKVFIIKCWLVLFLFFIFLLMDNYHFSNATKAKYESNDFKSKLQ